MGLGLDVQDIAGGAGFQQRQVTGPQFCIAVDGDGDRCTFAVGGLGDFLQGEKLLLVQDGYSVVCAGGVNVGKALVELGSRQGAHIGIDLSIDGGQGRVGGAGGPGPARRRRWAGEQYAQIPVWAN